MKDWPALQKRYQRDNPAVQIGGLASNLSRIAWFAQRSDLIQARPVLRESKYFTEWAAPSCSAEQQEVLAEIQLQLALWEREWGRSISPPSIVREAEQWSKRLLESAGLLG